MKKKGRNGSERSEYRAVRNPFERPRATGLAESVSSKVRERFSSLVTMWAQKGPVNRRKSSF